MENHTHIDNGMIMENHTIVDNGMIMRIGIFSMYVRNYQLHNILSSILKQIRIENYIIIYNGSMIFYELMYMYVRIL